MRRVRLSVRRYGVLDAAQEVPRERQGRPGDRARPASGEGGPQEAEEVQMRPVRREGQLSVPSRHPPQQARR